MVDFVEINQELGYEVRGGPSLWCACILCGPAEIRRTPAKFGLATARVINHSNNWRFCLWLPLNPKLAFTGWVRSAFGQVAAAYSLRLYICPPLVDETINIEISHQWYWMGYTFRSGWCRRAKRKQNSSPVKAQTLRYSEYFQIERSQPHEQNAINMLRSRLYQMRNE